MKLASLASLALLGFLGASASAGPTKPVKIAGYAYVEIPSEHIWAYEGEIANLKSTVNGDQTRYTLDVVDAAKKAHALELQLPKSLASPFVAGANVKVTLAAVGGGPNARGQIAMTDAAGLIVAISMVPAGWTTAAGKQVSATKDKTDDETTSAVKIGSGSDSVELVESWSSFELGKAKYVGNGSSVSRTLNVKLPPPDWVASWTDFAIVRVSAPAPAPAKKAMATPIKLAGTATITLAKHDRGTFSGSVGDLKSVEKGDERLYSFTVAGKAIVVELPKSLKPPFTQGANVKVTIATYDTWMPRGTITMTDDNGLVLAIDALPAGWTQTDGRVIASGKATSYNWTRHALAFAAPGVGNGVELGDDWAAFAIGSQRYVGYGSELVKTLTVQPTPPEWSGGSTGFAIIRTP